MKLYVGVFQCFETVAYEAIQYISVVFAVEDDGLKFISSQSLKESFWLQEQRERHDSANSACQLFTYFT